MDPEVAGSKPVTHPIKPLNTATRAAFQRSAPLKRCSSYSRATVFLHPKRKTYYHRSVVPRALKPYFKGREQLWRSLKTDHKNEAILKSAQWTARIQRLFLTLKKQGDHMTEEQREALVAHWLEAELDEAEDARTLAGSISDSYRGKFTVRAKASRKGRNPRTGEAMTISARRVVSFRPSLLLRAAVTRTE